MLFEGFRIIFPFCLQIYVFCLDKLNIFLVTILTPSELEFLLTSYLLSCVDIIIDNFWSNLT